MNLRDQEIHAVVRSIEELAQLFRDLQELAVAQGTILDRIDFHLENAVENVHQGIGELEKAEEHQQNALSTKCIVVLLVLIGVMILVLILKHSVN